MIRRGIRPDRRPDDVDGGRGTLGFRAGTRQGERRIRREIIGTIWRMGGGSWAWAIRDPWRSPSLRGGILLPPSADGAPLHGSGSSSRSTTLGEEEVPGAAPPSSTIAEGDLGLVRPVYASLGDGPLPDRDGEVLLNAALAQRNGRHGIELCSRVGGS
jgi:hypothetical protein